MRASARWRSLAVVAYLVALLCGGAAPVFAKGTPKPKPPTKPAVSGPVKPKECVECEPTWDGAVALAKAMNVPIVLHAHAFASSVSWDMHDNVMCSKEYMAFAVDNGVDVIVLRGIADGVAKKDPRAATYEARLPDGSKVRYLAELPGLTVADLEALEGTKAGEYNTSGQAPYTALVDPWDLSAGQQWTADVGVTVVMDAIAKARAVLEKWRGRSDRRADVKALFAAVADSDARLEKGDFTGAVAAMTTVKGAKSNASDRFRTSCGEQVRKVVAEAQKAIDAVMAKKTTDVLAARRELAALIPKLEGTGLREKAESLMDTLR